MLVLAAPKHFLKLDCLVQNMLDKTYLISDKGGKPINIRW